ncbi:MgtC/SapB family protein [Streptomyces sp. NPDC058412]|uniref:MgtC/SapB family protein n=1 Tax=Streptomyces sp. NPDC058412 TaxID=3346486 RepID=UPI003658CD61
MTSEWIMAGHMAAALGFGAAIGVERQWRARMAGLRTNALVAGGAAVFVLLSQYGFIGEVSEVQYDGSRVAAPGGPPGRSLGECPGSASSAPA